MSDGKKLRVLVVDDSVVIRRMLCDVIATDPSLEVVGTAPNGAIAVTRVQQLNPDLVTLDVEMPEMDGLEALGVLRKQHPRLPIIMFSTLTERGATATIDALTRGASDYVTKPANVGSVTAACEAIRSELIPKIKALCGRRGAAPLSGVRTLPAPSGIRPLPPAQGARPATSGVRTLPPPSGVRTLPPMSGVRTVAALPRGRVSAVVIGISTGGPNALAAMLPGLVADLPVPVLIVQHMPPAFTALLADRLAKVAQLPVREATGGERLGPRQVWVAPGGSHLVVAGGGIGTNLRLNQDPPENSCRPAADVLFRSAAAAFGGNVLGVVMTGMGADGQKGAEAIRAAGGSVIVQDEATSVVWGMPGSVVRAGAADQVLPLDQIAPEIVRRVRHGRTPSA